MSFLRFYKIEQEKKTMEAVSRFVDAAACGDLEDVKRMLADPETSKETINYTDKDGRSSLHYACLNDDTNLLPLLLADDRVDVGKLTPNQECVFHLAALYNSLQAINMLLQSERVTNHPDKLLNLPNKFGETPLHLCAGTGNKDSGRTAIVLMEAGASLIALDKWKRGPIDVAKFNGHNWLADVLIEFVGKQPQSLQDQVKTISEAALKERLAPVPVSEQAKENKKAMRNMFAGGLKINLKKTETVEKQMFSSAQGKIVGSSVAGKNQMATFTGKVLSKLIDFPGNKEEISKLVKDPEVNVAGKDAFGLTALHKFASWNKTELIDLILPQLSPEQLNDTDLEGKTALHWACEMASVATVGYLVEKGANKEIKDNKGRTPLDILNSGEGTVIERLKKALA